MQLLARFIVVCLLLNLSAAVAEPLPDPLTLEYILSLAPETHPVLDNAAADVAVAKALVDQANASNGLRVSLEGRLRHTEP